MTIQERIDEFTSKGWYVSMAIRVGGFVDVTIVGRNGIVLSNLPLQHNSIMEALDYIEEQMRDLERIAAGYPRKPVEFEPEEGDPA